MIVLWLIALMNISVSIAPIGGILKEIGGEYFDYKVIYPTSANPHMYEPRPEDILKVKNSQVFIYSGRAEPGAIKLCKIAKRCISIEKRLNIERTINPHIWLSPKLVKEILDTFSLEFATLLPQFRDTFILKAEKIKSKIDTILEKSKREDRPLVLLMHSAFEPLFRELGFDVLIVSKEPGMEPKARRLKELSDILKRKDVILGVCEKSRPCKPVRMLAKSYDFNIIVLNPLYEETFTDFLQKAVLTIKNASNSSY